MHYIWPSVLGEEAREGLFEAGKCVLVEAEREAAHGWQPMGRLSARLSKRRQTDRERERERESLRRGRHLASLAAGQWRFGSTKESARDEQRRD